MIVVKVDVYLPDYCVVCDYKCCAPNCDGDCLADVCRSHPFMFNKAKVYQGPYGLLGDSKASIGYWSFNCGGADIKLFNKPLRALFNELIYKLTYETKPFEFKREGVEFKTIPLSPEKSSNLIRLLTKPVTNALPWIEWL